MSAPYPRRSLRATYHERGTVRDPRGRWARPGPEAGAESPRRPSPSALFRPDSPGPLCLERKRLRMLVLLGPWFEATPEGFARLAHATGLVPYDLRSRIKPGCWGLLRAVGDGAQAEALGRPPAGRGLPGGGHRPAGGIRPGAPRCAGRAGRAPAGRAGAPRAGPRHAGALPVPHGHRARRARPRVDFPCCSQQRHVPPGRALGGRDAGVSRDSRTGCRRFAGGRPGIS